MDGTALAGNIALAGLITAIYFKFSAKIEEVKRKVTAVEKKVVELSTDVKWLKKLYAPGYHDEEEEDNSS